MTETIKSILELIQNFDFDVQDRIWKLEKMQLKYK